MLQWYIHKLENDVNTNFGLFSIELCKNHSHLQELRYILSWMWEAEKESHD
jgi:hypothetical protein